MVSVIISDSRPPRWVIGPPPRAGPELNLNPIWATEVGAYLVECTDVRREDSGLRGVRKLQAQMHPGSNLGQTDSAGGGLQALWGAPMAAYSRVQW